MAVLREKRLYYQIVKISYIEISTAFPSIPARTSDTIDLKMHTSSHQLFFASYENRLANNSWCDYTGDRGDTARTRCVHSATEQPCPVAALQYLHLELEDR